MRICILTRPDFKSPRVLAESLKIQLAKQGVESEIFYEINLLNRLVSFKDSQLSFHFWLKRKLSWFFTDRKLIQQLQKFDAIVICECAPNAFMKRLFNVEKLKEIFQKPIGFYAVYYLGNAPTQIDFLTRNKQPLLDRYDFHLAVADITELKLPVSANYFPIGINAESWNIQPLPKKELMAIVDFAQPGYETYREIQIQALEMAGINFISLENSYTFEEIRKIYQSAAIYFMQSDEALGMPILECLSGGCQIFTPHVGWPRSWRLNKPGMEEDRLPGCFTVYDNEEQLIKKLSDFKINFNLRTTPKEIFDEFFLHYPAFYSGNTQEERRFLKSLEN